MDVAANDVPSGIPTGVPQVVNDAATKVVTEGGVLGSVLIVVGFLCVLLVIGLIRTNRRLEQEARESRQEWGRREDELLREIQGAYEKRVEDLNRVVEAIHNSTAAIGVLSQTQQDRLTTARDMAQQLDRVALLAANNKDLAERNYRAIEAGIGRVVAALQGTLATTQQRAPGGGR